MFDTSTLETELFNINGWQNWHDLTEIPALTGTLNTSDFGFFYNEGEEITSLKFIQATMPNGKDLSVHLSDLNKKNAKEIVQLLVKHKKEFMQVKDNVSSFDLFKGAGRTPITPGNRFVGYKLEVLYKEGLEIIINDLKLHFSQAQTDLDIYVFHDSQVSPVIGPFQVSTTNAGSFQAVTIPEIKLPYSTADYAGGYYYIGYYEEDITGSAINFNFDVSKRCGHCPGLSNTYAFERSKYMSAQAIAVSDFTKGESHDPAKEYYAHGQTFGLNMNFSVKCNITEFLLKNKRQFVEPMLANMKKIVANQYLNTTQINAIQSMTQDYIVFERNEQAAFVESSMKALNMDFSDFNSPCLPCPRKRGPRYSNMHGR